MKKLSFGLTIIALVLGTTFSQAQTPTGKNGNYKHQFPKGKGTIKEAFKNDTVEDHSARNYKKVAKTTKTDKTAVSKNFSSATKDRSINSKHPYGL